MSNYKKCDACGAFIDANSTFCPNCGHQSAAAPDKDTYGQNPYTGGNTGNNPYSGVNNYSNSTGDNGIFSRQFLDNDAFAASPGGASRGVAAILAIVLGSLGIHYFYMKKNTPGLIFLLCTLLSCGILGTVISLISLAQGIYMFMISNREFYYKYIISTNTLPLF